MVIISSAELRNNMKKYLDIAKNEKVVIQRGKNETFVLVAQNVTSNEDLNRAITVDEVLARVREGLNEMFERKEGHNIA
ncbi:MAG: type II toxin-antitoxin system Phd/YefM family antitoxin [Bacteroidales bacterium]|nr:type II toxin-antitoxin system Phd/YefM family antitoxin [Bacteroidales bacterium]